MLKECGPETLQNMYGITSGEFSSFELYKAFVEVVLAGVGVRRQGKNKAGRRYWESNKRFIPIVEMYTISDEAWAFLIFLNCRHVWDYDIKELKKDNCYSPRRSKSGGEGNIRPDTRWTRQKKVNGIDKGNAWTKEGKEMYNDSFLRIDSFRKSSKGKMVVSRLVEAFKEEEKTKQRNNKEKRDYSGEENALSESAISCNERPFKMLRETFGDD